MTTVALVTSSFLPRFGGVEEHVLHVARGLRARGHRVVVWAVDQHDQDAPSFTDGFPVRYLPCPMPARSATSLAHFAARAPVAAARWLAAHRAYRPDVLHVHCYGPNGPWATALAAATRTPLVVSAHGETFMDAADAFGTSALLRAGLRHSLGRADAVTGCSEYVLADLDRYGLDRSRATVVPNGIDLDQPAEPLRVGLPDAYLLAVGRMVDTKGFDLLLDAFASADLPGVGLVLGGDGPERGALAARAARLGVADRVVLPGRLTRGQVASAASGALAFVVPSRIEAFGIVVLEGWRAGVPVVVTSRGGPPGFVADGVTGLVVDPFDTGALANALERLLGDPDLAGRLGAAGRAEAVHYPWSRVTGDYERIYEALAVQAGIDPALTTGP